MEREVFNIHSVLGIEFGDCVQKDFVDTAVGEPYSVLLLNYFPWVLTNTLVLPFPSDGKANVPSLSFNSPPSFSPEMVLPLGQQRCSINSSKAAIFTKREEGNLDNILQGDWWFCCPVIQLQHEAQQFLQRIAQLSFHLAVDSPVQGFIDHPSQVLQQLQTETKEAI